MTEQELKDMKELDEIAEKAGGYVNPYFTKDVLYDYRKIAKYCKEKCIDPLDLTIRELGQFVIPEL